MTKVEDAVQAELRPLVDRLIGIRSELRQLVESLPGPPEEDVVASNEDEMDVTTEVRSIIECVLSDSIQPAIRDLRVAAAYRVKGGPAGFKAEEEGEEK
jgi:hypothetical protein